MNEIKSQSERPQVGSSLDLYQEHFFSKGSFYDVYSVNKSKKHYQWCLESVQKGLKNLALALSIAPSTGLVKHYQQRTNQVEETLAEKVAVAFAFSAAVLLLCFSTFVVF